MNTNAKISRGLECLMAKREGAKLEGLHGLAGLGEVESFNQLGALLRESREFVGVDKHVRDLRAKHREMCDRTRAALPLAIDAMRMKADDPTMSGIFSKIGNALKKVAKVAVKLSPSRLLLKKVAPKLEAKLNPIGNALDPLKVKAKTQAQIDAAAAKKAAKAAAKQAKKDAKAAAAAAALAAAGVTPQMTPEQAGGAVLADQAWGGGGGGGGSSPAAQQFAQDTVADAAATGDDGTILGMTPMVAAGAAVAGAAVLYLMLRKKRG
jgi:hypothetical protein